jgi:hypothetical protein
MLSDKQINKLFHSLTIIGRGCYGIEEIEKWYQEQPTHNTIHSNKEADYKDQIIRNKIKNADYWLVSSLIGELDKIIYVAGEYDINEIMDKIYKL